MEVSGLNGDRPLGTGDVGFRLGPRINAAGRIARAFIELHRIDKPITVVGEKVGERLMLRNSYDRSSSLIFEMGALVVKCLNGAVMPQGNLGFSGHHTGDLRKGLNAFIKKLAGIEAALGARMIEAYKDLDKKVSPEIAREIVKRSLGERNQETVLKYWQTGIGRDGFSWR